MATKAQAARPSPVPPTGTYLTDCDRRQLYRVEAIHKREGVVIENCRTLALFMLTIREFQRQGFRVLR